MKIRAKIILAVLPLIVVSLCLAQAASYFQAAAGVTRITQLFFTFKARELEKYAENQWSLLVENGYAHRPDMAAAAMAAVEIYAETIILSDTEIIFAVDDQGAVTMGTAPISLGADEWAALKPLVEAESEGVQSALLGGERRVFRAFYFTPFRWRVILSEKEPVFYQDANRIARNTLLILLAASLGSALLLLLFARQVTNPLARVIAAMNRIITQGDMAARVAVEYRDETGNLAHTFNLMTGELEKAYALIKRHAFESALAGRKEQRIRLIFQKYVPKDLIDKFFASPESMLIGENRILSILFSDIRGFTAISEAMAPEDLVRSLNRYFSAQVDIIMNRNGIVDKYIGDAIMAFWGAPVKHDDDALQSVLAGLDMIDAVKVFNQRQKDLGQTEFQIGVGINYGAVTVGNIGSERKMDYTVIGDTVNLASRMEGLTKTYHENLLISETLYAALRKQEAAGGRAALPCRLLDTVAVKGKTRGVKIFAVKRSLAGEEPKAWALHNRGMERYYRRDFSSAAEHFQQVLQLLPGDFNAANLLKRCAAYRDAAPPPDWNGVEVMRSK
ncbi:MAG: adenylate/guanylate cyclase domain-containing protein [Treponema sp.]|jgi:class 3 adenylate cyclase/HAMP domain-containing protein|nr:adenylate/guanylate cyclase domain-containing protein [Treponema sp.]